MRSWTNENRSLWHRLHRKLNRRDHKEDLSDDTASPPHPKTQAGPSDATNKPTPVSHHASSTATSSHLKQESNPHEKPSNIEHNDTHSKNDQTTLLLDATEEHVAVPSDLWSAAYREAIETFGEELDIAILKGKNVARLFEELEEINKEVVQESAFKRGVDFLHSIQGPLEKFKLALDLASPLTNLEPTAATVTGIVSSVTAIAISLASADIDFANQIAEMLKHIPYIDGCDTLGQKSNDKDIHQALVLVYQKLLEFYKVAFEILTRKGAHLLWKLITENGRLPGIVSDFLKLTDTLQSLIEKAKWEIVKDLQDMAYDNQIRNWLHYDKVKRQSSYHIELGELRADEACNFLLTNTEFINWYHASDSRQLVILGDMGCGKSVTMAWVVDELKRRREYLFPGPKICHYYCHADETGQYIYILSSLILSLLDQLPGLKKPFFGWYKQGQVSGNDPSMNPATLEEFLQKVLEAVERQVFLVIDGLDECDPTSRHRLLRLLKRLSGKIPGLKCILSSRPNEDVIEELGDISRIYVFSDPQRDSAIVRKTVDDTLFYLSAEVKAVVVNHLSSMAKGSAIWTKLTVELIKITKLRAINPMRSFLERLSLPNQLTKLYTTILSRCTSDDPDNQELACAALKILATTLRPLSILELSWAAALCVSQHVSTVAALANLVDHQRMMSLLYPFIAHVDFSDLKKRQVRLVHHSVKEYVENQQTDNQHQDPALKYSVSPILKRPAESLQAFILNICIRYLFLKEIGDRYLFSEAQLAIAELPQDSDIFSDENDARDYDPYCSWDTWEKNMIRYDPTERGFGEFFIYASCYWPEHFGDIGVEPLPSLECIEKLCHAGSLRIHNWIEQLRRPDCAINPRIEFDSNLYDPLSITSLYGSETMLCHMLAKSDFSREEFLQNSVMKAADQLFQWGDVSRLRIILLSDKVGHELRNLDFFRLALKHWFYPKPKKHNWDHVFDLVDYVLDDMVQQQWGNELLRVAAGAGCMPIIQRLMTAARHNAFLETELLRDLRSEQSKSIFGETMHQSIGEAVKGNHVEVVSYLLGVSGIEKHISYQNVHGENVLHLASRLCNPEMFRLLVPHFPDGVLQANTQGDTPLLQIIMRSSASQDRLESAKILLSESNVDWSKLSWTGGHDPISAALQIGDSNMCRLLFDVCKINPLPA